MDERLFREEIKAQGFSEPELLFRDANLFNAEHSHEFDVSVLIVSGELTVSTPDGETTCRAGDRFALDRNIPHTEQYGSAGTQVLVGKRQ